MRPNTAVMERENILYHTELYYRSVNLIYAWAFLVAVQDRVEDQEGEGLVWRLMATKRRGPRFVFHCDLACTKLL